MGLSADLELLSDPLRVRILALLEQDELTVGELGRALQTPQPTVSRHLKALLQEDWLTRRTAGTAAHLRLAALNPQRHGLWALVKADPALERDLLTDRDHMARVLAERMADGATFFGRVADGWDVLRDQLFGRRFLTPALVALVPRHFTVIDLGCGTGELLSHLAPAVARVIGVDREPSMLEIARRRLAAHAHVELIEAALESVPLPSDTADAALLGLVLHHLPDPALVLAEARRLLAPSGQLVVVDMQPHDNASWRAFGHLHRGFSADDLAALAASAGLVVRAHQHLPADPDAQGPPLFVATLCASASDSATTAPDKARARKATAGLRRSR
jgi:ArsR family transcriptional regulator